jgi:multisubunit Na+/H+ antiporter MnhB subunit
LNLAVPDFTFYEIAAQVLPFFAITVLLGSEPAKRSYVDAGLALIQFAAFAVGEWIAFAILYHHRPVSDLQERVVLGSLIASGAALAVRVAAKHLIPKE